MRPSFLAACVAMACATVFCLADEKQLGSPNVNTRAVPPWQSYESMHEDNVHQFIKSPGLGMSRLVETLKKAEKDETESVAIALSRRVSIGDQLFSIKNIELIGVAKHDPPVMFRNPIVHSISPKAQTPEASEDTISQQQSSVDNKATKHDFRELTDFEQAVITTFRKGGWLSIRADESDRVVLGPIRARQECISCHEGTKKGDVLEVSFDDEVLGIARLQEVSQSGLQGGVYVTVRALHEILARELPVTWPSLGGRFVGRTVA